MSIAPARLYHLPHLSVMLWSFTRATPWLPRVRSRCDDLRTLSRAIRRGWVQVIRHRRGPAGFIARDGARIHALYVHPLAQGRGLGRALLADAKAKSPRLELFVVQANETARAFYAAQGFQEVAQGTGTGNDENLPDILMVWRMKPEEPA